MNYSVDQIRNSLKLIRSTSNDEKKLQDLIENSLEQSKIQYLREWSIDRRSRPDFLCGNIVIEVKTKCGQSSMLRQCMRYAKNDCVRSIILVTKTPIRKAPRTLNGKRFEIVELWKNLI